VHVRQKESEEAGVTASTQSGFACCAGAQWCLVADIGHARSFDFALGRCGACGKYWMQMWSPFADGGYAPVAEADATRLAGLPAGPERERLLGEFFDL
jgi:hypothetical protein